MHSSSILYCKENKKSLAGVTLTLWIESQIQVQIPPDRLTNVFYNTMVSLRIAYAKANDTITLSSIQKQMNMH